MILARVTHDVSSNTLEATWQQAKLDVNGTLIGYEPVKCRNYSIEQKLDFQTDLGINAPKYITLAGW